MRTCEVKDCARRFYGRGLCQKHYQGWRKYRHNDDVVQAHVGRICSVEGCGLRHYGLGYCKAHHRRVWRRGSPELYKREPRKFKHGHYIGRWIDGKQILEHRLIMESMIGRKLLPGETVHHINGIKTDNRPENLQLWASIHPSGQRVEDLLAFAYEVIARYGAHTGQQLEILPMGQGDAA